MNYYKKGFLILILLFGLGLNVIIGYGGVGLIIDFPSSPLETWQMVSFGFQFLNLPFVLINIIGLMQLFGLKKSGLKNLWIGSGVLATLTILHLFLVIAGFFPTISEFIFITAPSLAALFILPPLLIALFYRQDLDAS